MRANSQKNPLISGILFFAIIMSFYSCYQHRNIPRTHLFQFSKTKQKTKPPAQKDKVDLVEIKTQEEIKFNASQAHSELDLHEKDLVNKETDISGEGKAPISSINTSEENHLTIAFDAKARIDQSKEVQTSSNSKPYRSAIMLFGAVLAALSSSLVFRGERMKNLSRWASKHPKISQPLLFPLQIGIGYMAWLFANVMASEGIELPTELSVGLGGALLISYLVPKKKQAGYSKSRRAITLFSVLGFLFLGSLWNSETTYELQANGNQERVLESEHASNKALGTIMVWRDAVFPASDQTEHKNTPNDAIAVLLIILYTAILAALILVLATLSCSLACSGYEIAAVLLFFLGSALAIVGFVFLVRNTIHQMRARKEAKEELYRQEQEPAPQAE